MSNHFHILVEIPLPPEDRGRSWSDERFLEHISCRYRGEAFEEIATELAKLRDLGDDEAAEAYRDKFFARMWDLAAFMHDLKMRFTRWFNRHHDRDGHLWGAKFRSLLVENGLATRIVAAYIDLNPLRAGMVEDPADYRWSGYGEAVAGLWRAREGSHLPAGRRGSLPGQRPGLLGTWRKPLACCRVEREGRNRGAGLGPAAGEFREVGRGAGH